MLYKGLNKLLPQASQAMPMLSWEIQLLALRCKFFSFHRQEIEIGREGAQKVQDVMAAIITDYTFTFHRRAKLHRGILLVEHSMSLHLQRATGLLQKLQILWMRHNSLAKVDGSVDDALLLFPLQDARNDGLRGYTVTSVVHYHRAKGVKPLHVYSTVRPHPVQIIGGGGMGSGIATQLPVMVTHVEAQAEKNVVPDEHLHARLLSRIDRHDVAVNHRHCATRCCGSKIAMNLEYGSLSEKTLGEVLTRKFSGGLELLIPVSSL